ncbi:sugar phosphate isomerase/epimerase [Paenibacillus nanensis]|uniref:Sugar phosphate isomerase/epimerase n=1 Tax=Paenibacillus nanensis TaxID=393251 RepID=A0A3A1VRS7_9BACL|nr:sugar phosphate isomerase/epimerase [Paenibacillus nanensis]
MSYLSVSTWSLHRLLGPLRWTVWDESARARKTVIQEQPELLNLLDLPEEAAKRGFKAVEICHFHFPSTDSAYLEQLKKAFVSAGISFDTLLLDYGDLSTADSERAEADMSFMREWIRAASIAGAKRTRIVAGEAQPGDAEALERTAGRLLQLAEFAETLSVQIITENFKALTSTGESCMRLMDKVGGKVGLITDFGNFGGERKYTELAMTIPVSVGIHAKSECDEQGYPDEAEFQRCLEAVRQSGFDGSFVIIYDGPGDMWAGIDRVRRLVEPVLA